jgi:hypothetical protein
MDFAPCDGRPTLRALDWRRFFEKKLGKKLQRGFAESDAKNFKEASPSVAKTFK